MDFAAPLKTVVDTQMGMCLSDTFISLLDSLPPAAAADRAWSSRCRGARNPLSSFLPQRHTLDSLGSELKRLIQEHNRPFPDPEERIETICQDFIKKFCLDEVLFDYLPPEQQDDIEEEIIDEVKCFIEDALIASVLSDFTVFPPQTMALA